MAAKPGVQTCVFGTPPDPSKPIQQYAGVSTKFLPHEALVVYTEKIMAERAAFQNPSSKKWFREHKKHKREEEKLMQFFKDHRTQKKQEAEETIRRNMSE